MRVFPVFGDARSINDVLMPTIELDDETYRMVRFAARLLGVSESDVVARAVRAFSGDGDPAPAVAGDPWEPVPLYGEYEGQRIDAEYVRATRRLAVTSGPVAGQTFSTPSAAATAVIAALKPDRAFAQTNGWKFWRIAATHQRLETLRQT